MVDHFSRFTFTKRRIYYFSRRVPLDLRVHYNKDRIVISLRTKSKRTAEIRATALANKLDEDWLALRRRSSDDLLSRFQVDGSNGVPINSTAPTMSEAMDIYLKAKAQRHVGGQIVFINRHGSKPMPRIKFFIVQNCYHIFDVTTFVEPAVRISLVQIVDAEGIYKFLTELDRRLVVLHSFKTTNEY